MPRRGRGKRKTSIRPGVARRGLFEATRLPAALEGAGEDRRPAHFFSTTTGRGSGSAGARYRRVALRGHGHRVAGRVRGRSGHRRGATDTGSRGARALRRRLCAAPKGRGASLYLWSGWPGDESRRPQNWSRLYAAEPATSRSCDGTGQERDVGTARRPHWPWVCHGGRSRRRPGRALDARRLLSCRRYGGVSFRSGAAGLAH
mmetsp:Transcript_10736/g.31651  ORF Transcript_10736/g.31651 Transcript_10736/m.31651 type:complete len:203 (-) Transcript_10736:102-710(-)